MIDRLQPTVLDSIFFFIIYQCTVARTTGINMSIEKEYNANKPNQ